MKYRSLAFFVLTLFLVPFVYAPEFEKNDVGDFRSSEQLQRTLSDPEIPLKNVPVTQPITTSSTAQSSPVNQISIPPQSTISNSPQSFSASKISQATANDIRIGPSSDISFNREDSSVSAKQNSYLRLETNDLPYYAIGNKNIQLSQDQSLTTDSTTSFTLPNSFFAMNLKDVHYDTTTRTLTFSSAEKIIFLSPTYHTIPSAGLSTIQFDEKGEIKEWSIKILQPVTIRAQNPIALSMVDHSKIV